MSARLGLMLFGVLCVFVVLFGLIWQSLHSWPGLFAPEFATQIAKWMASILAGSAIGMFFSKLPPRPTA